MIEKISLFINELNIAKQKQDIYTLFNYFFGNNYIFFIIFLLAIQYILIKLGYEKIKNKEDKNTSIIPENTIIQNRKVRNFFGMYVIFIFIIIWNPYCVGVLQKMINFGSMYRIYYMIPWCFTIAVYFSIMISKINNKVLKLIGVVFCSGIIMYFGTNIFNEWTTIETSNLYKVYDEAVAVADAIMEDSKYDEKRAVVPYKISPQIQQVHSEIWLPYTRVVWNQTDENGNPSPSDSDDASNYPPVKAMDEGNVKYIMQMADSHKLNYIVINKSVELSEDLEGKNFELFNETEEHYIYRRK